MNEKDMNELLLNAFPSLRDEFDGYTSWQDGIETGAFLTYEDVFRPKIEDAVKKQDVAYLNKVAEFVEKLLESDDEYATNVVTVGILEGLKANCDGEEVRSFLRSKATSIFEDLEL